MDTIPPPRVIVVHFPTGRSLDWYINVLRWSGCIIYECKPSSIPLPSFVQRLFKRPIEYVPNVKAAYEFVVKYYQAGDHVLLLDELAYYYSGDRQDLQNNQHIAIWQLATALDTGSLPGMSANGSMNAKIPIKCIFLNFSHFTSLQWPGVHRSMSKFPSTVENFLCVEDSRHGGLDRYVVQRGSHGQIKRKEAWHSGDFSPSIWAWLLLETSHIIEYQERELAYFRAGFQSLVSAVNYSNCTKRRRGLPCDGAIPTGGQLVRLIQVQSLFHTCLVWSSQSYAEGEYTDVCNTPLIGPTHL